MGYRAPRPGNAIALARKPYFDELWATYPHAALEASGPSVGLPEGQMGNSEVGHLTLGAGAAVPQTLTLIDDAVAERTSSLTTRCCAAALSGRPSGSTCWGWSPTAASTRASSTSTR